MLKPNQLLHQEMSYLKEGGLATTIGTKKHPQLARRDMEGTILQNWNRLPLLVGHREAHFMGFNGRSNLCRHDERSTPTIPARSKSSSIQIKNHKRRESLQEEMNDLGDGFIRAVEREAHGMGAKEKTSCSIENKREGSNLCYVMTGIWFTC